MNHKQYEELIVIITKARSQYKTKYSPFLLIQEREFITLFFVSAFIIGIVFFTFMRISELLGRYIFDQRFYIEGSIINIIICIIYLGKMWYTKYILSFFQKLIDMNAILYHSMDQNDSNENILNKITTIKDNTIQFEKIRESLRIREYNTFDKYINSAIQFEKEWLIEIIEDLKMDISINITKQQKTLQSAKSEVESNIKGTTELEQVSELQRTRLDKQIEQFEELQRVLVKV